VLLHLVVQPDTSLSFLYTVIKTLLLFIVSKLTSATSASIPVVESTHDRGVTLNSQLTLSAHITALCWASYCQLQQLYPVVQSMTAEAARTVAASFISSGLDYCNSLFHSMPDTLLCKLQSVQNATTRLITRHCDHITPVLPELHLLPIRESVKFKVACLVRQSLSGHVPVYLADDCCLFSHRTLHFVQSADVLTYFVPRKYSNYIDRTFAAAGPRLWNSLPVHLRIPDITYKLFR